MAPSVPPEPGRRPLAKGSACEACKLRKVRCDAGRPTCRNCLKHGKKCDYPEPKDDRSRRGTRDGASLGQYDPGHNAAPSHSSSYSAPLSLLVPSTALWNREGSTLDHPASYLDPTPSTSQPSAIPRQGPIFQSFYPSIGEGNDEQIPVEWSDVDLSWVLDEPQISEEAENPFTPLDHAAQLHCLCLFFTNQSASGLEMSIARFHERLESPNEEDRPHPALLNAIYLITCHASPLRSVRIREQYFLQQIETSLHEAFKIQMGLPRSMLDLMRAEILLAEYMWTHARESEAIMGTARACRIALASCFDRIPSSFDATPYSKICLRFQRKPLFMPPRDLIDVADRIYAFWSFVLLDLSASVASKLPSNIDPFSIKTPLPIPWSAYTASEPLPDRRLTDIFGANPAKIQSDFGYIIQAMFLLHVASCHLLQRSPTTRQDSASPPSASDQRWHPGQPFQAISIEDLSAAVDRLVKEIPDRLRWKSFSQQAGQPTPTTAISLHLIICCTRIHIADTNTYGSSNDSAMYHVRHMVDSIKLLDQDQIAKLGLAIYVLWDLAALVLLREIKRLRRRGDDIAIVTLEADLDFLVETLTVLSIGRPLLQEEVHGLTRLRDTPPSDVDTEEDGMRDEEVSMSTAGDAGSLPGLPMTTPDGA
ncbi:hypothetical protein IAU59_005500 [Kwoniella sp. CBS 9459]